MACVLRMAASCRARRPSSLTHRLTTQVRVGDRPVIGVDKLSIQSWAPGRRLAGAPWRRWPTRRGPRHARHPFCITGSKFHGSTVCELPHRRWSIWCWPRTRGGGCAPLRQPSTRRRGTTEWRRQRRRCSTLPLRARVWRQWSASTMSGVGVHSGMTFTTLVFAPDDRMALQHLAAACAGLATVVCVHHVRWRCILRLKFVTM